MVRAKGALFAATAAVALAAPPSLPDRSRRAARFFPRFVATARSRRPRAAIGPGYDAASRGARALARWLCGDRGFCATPGVISVTYVSRPFAKMSARTDDAGAAIGGTSMVRCRLSRKVRERLIVAGLVVGSLALALASNLLLV